ncbi:hypothetical protein TUSST3_09920 [Streptomyces sp. TUS-ST3]|uniref:hypothetical protein n=1 Tax=Streptomyces sp. TUS-ST3 TaxID=3025591 RepID=UPI0024E0891D|nr:hypothetical protein [Streptomyces sp. TUS-ST3]GLP64372.1 hypothetical protein TUSST3_09920 [Streptomyces sp. TUS-ST3]
MGAILTCKGCGATKLYPTGDPTDLFPSEHCGDCPPWICEGCGETCSAVALCSCWVQLDTLLLADVKALFGADGTFSVDPA